RERAPGQRRDQAFAASADRSDRLEPGSLARQRSAGQSAALCFRSWKTPLLHTPLLTPVLLSAQTFLPSPASSVQSPSFHISPRRREYLGRQDVVSAMRR